MTTDDFDLGPCPEQSPDGSLRCTLQLGHVGWHSSEGSTWYHSVWGFRQPAEPTVDAEPIKPVKPTKKTPAVSRRIVAVVRPRLWVARAVVMSAPALGAIASAAAGQFTYSFWLLLLAPISVVCAELIKNRPDPGDIHAEHQRQAYEAPHKTRHDSATDAERLADAIKAWSRRAEYLKRADFATDSAGVTTPC